ncbi:hypothetical protein BTVI_07250 [Pitangus sulphuratus]|nr:hypothetical protein BTVI_07250 [Pitangus sulphuratus]
MAVSLLLVSRFSIPYEIQFTCESVRHRWCELVIKHKYVPGYGDVERFLREDQDDAAGLTVNVGVRFVQSTQCWDDFCLRGDSQKEKGSTAIHTQIDNHQQNLEDEGPGNP